jgi:hypothetical protein
MRKIALPIVVPLGLLLLLGIWFAFDPNTPIATLGGVLIGSSLSIGTAFGLEEWKRNREAHDVAVVLYHELALRVMRCCYDFEKPWGQVKEVAQIFDKFRAGKFTPMPPTIFDAKAEKLALLKPKIASTLMSFYYRLAVISRDIDNTLADVKDGEKLSEKDVLTIASRFGQALRPGELALKALDPLVTEWSAIDQDALDAIDTESPKRQPGTLRKRLADMVAKAGGLGL